MKTVISTLLILHVIGGGLALLSAPLAVLLRRNTPKHRIAGRVYFYSMIAVTATALFIAFYKNIPFLFMVGIFSFYAIWDARRALALKQLHLNQKPKWYDWGVGIITFCFNFLLLAYGVLKISEGVTMGWVAVVFGLVGVSSVFASLRKFVKRPTDPRHWLYNHVSGMLAGYIATVTAFLVVNNTFLPPVVAWIGPTIVGSSFITWLMFRLRTGKE